MAVSYGVILVDEGTLSDDDIARIEDHTDFIVVEATPGRQVRQVYVLTWPAKSVTAEEETD